ncbi:MAG: nucleotidyltransferase family protein [Actinomycetota bacterium]
MLETAAARALTRRIAAFGIDGEEREIAVAGRDGRRILAHISAERLSGIASAAAHAGMLDFEDRYTADLHAMHADDMAWTLALERALLAIADEASRTGVEFIVLKGPALAHRFYPDPSWRAFTDIDLLVRTDDWRRACEVLERTGFRRERPEPRSGFDERFGKAAVHVDAGGLNVDLHRTLVLGSFGVWMDPEELFERTVPFTVAGVPLRRLDDTAMMLHACVHAALGFKDPLLMPLRDLAQVATLGDIDWVELGEWAGRWKLNGVAGHAFDEAQRLLGFEPPAEVAAVRAGPVGRRERRALKAYTTDRRARGGTARTAFWATRGVRAKAGLLRAMLFPDHAFLAARTERDARPSYVRRWAVPLRWLLRRR